MTKVTFKPKENKNINRYFNKKEYFKNVSETLEKVSKDIQKDAKANAPVDTGRLRDSISIEKISDIEYKIYSDLEYALPQEEGTVYIPSNRYMYRAYQKNKKNVLKELSKNFETNVKKLK